MPFLMDENRELDYKEKLFHTSHYNNFPRILKWKIIRLKARANKTCINFIIFILIFVENCLNYDALHYFSEWLRTGPIIVLKSYWKIFDFYQNVIKLNLNIYHFSLFRFQWIPTESVVTVRCRSEGKHCL